VDIADQGIGIAAAAIPALFQALPHAQCRGSLYQQGVGLYVVEIVELHGGEVAVTSAEGQGGMFLRYACR
jgi:signal transduction histidine kinase